MQHTSEPDYSLLRTLVASEVSGGIVEYDKAKEKGNMISLTAQLQKFLPTPLASDAENPLKLRDQMNITKAVRMLPTPRVSGQGISKAELDRNTPNIATEALTNWEQFAPAIQRWEQIIGRPAPSPLVEQRLNPEFTEWLMGLPEGWITDLDLSWTQKIKACGNGVVPQQAKLALERLVK